MADEQLRMQAVVTDGFSAPLRKLNSLLGETAKHPAGRWLKNEWQGVATSFDRITTGLNTGLAPALSRIGVTSLGVTGAVVGIGAAIKSFAAQTQTLSVFSREIGLSVTQLREMKAVSEHFGVGWDSAQGSLKQFAGNLDGLRRRWGETYGALRGMNLGSLAEDLAKAPNMQAAVDTALEGLKGIANPVYRRKVAELLFGSDQWATIASELTPRVRKEIQSMLSDLPKGSEEAAVGFNLGLTKMQLGIDEFRNQAIGPLMKDVNEAFAVLNRPETYVSIKSQWDGLTSRVKDLATALTAIRDFGKAVSEGEWGKAGEQLGTGAKSLGRLGLPGALGLIPDDKPQSAAGLQAKIKDLEEKRAANDANPLTRGRVPERQAELTKEIEKLTNELKRLRETGGATKQDMSFDGSGVGGFGGLIHKANLGFGGGGGGRGFWRFDGRTWKRSTEGDGRDYPGSGDVYLPPAQDGGPNRRTERERSGSAASPGDRVFGMRGAYRFGRDDAAAPRGRPGRLSEKYPPDLPGAIRQSAKDLGISAEDLATAISYETGGTFDPWKKGPTTKWGTHRGLIQWGEPQAKKYGVSKDSSVAEQMRAVTRYLRDAGVKEGMGLPEIYSAINAGRVGKMGASDRPGYTVQRHVAEMRGPHGRRARALLGAEQTETADRAGDRMMGRSFGPGGVAAGAPKMEATGAVNITLMGGLEKLPARVSTEGLFRDVKVSRGSQMSTAEE